MKHYLLIAIIFLSAGRLSAQHIISEKGVDSVVINKTGLKDVLRFFPKGTAEYRISGGDSEWVSIRWMDGGCSHMKKWVEPDTMVWFNDKKEGIRIYFNKYRVVSAISVWGKYKFATDRGIIIGKSTFHDLDSIYGTKEWNKSNGLYEKRPALIKTYKNISFCAKPKAKLRREDKMLIDHIEVTQ